MRDHLKDARDAVTRAGVAFMITPEKTVKVAAVPDKPGTVPVELPADGDRQRWYEFDWLAKSKDVIGVLGFLVAVAGIALIHVPAAMIAGGIALVVFAFYLAKV